MLESVVKIKDKIENFALKPAFVFVVCVVAFIFHALALDLAGLLIFAFCGGLFFVFLDDCRPAVLFSDALKKERIFSRQNRLFRYSRCLFRSFCRALLRRKSITMGKVCCSRSWALHPISGFMRFSRALPTVSKEFSNSQ